MTLESWRTSPETAHTMAFVEARAASQARGLDVASLPAR
jgi:hypothetical protein